MKLCKSFCKLYKCESEFNKRKSSKDGLQSYCRECQSKLWKENREKMSLHKKEYRKKEVVKQHEIKYKKVYYQQNKEKFKERKQKYKQRRNELCKEKRKNNKIFHIKEIIKSHTRRIIIHKKLSKSIYLKCNYSFLKKWIEFQFEKWMNWENYGMKWHFDHIIPISKFNFNNKNEIYICYNWTNLQPLEKKENISNKNDKIQLHHYFNSIINVHRFIQKSKKDFDGYKAINNSLIWLKQKLNDNSQRNTI